MSTPPLKSHTKFHFWSTPNNYALALICWSNTLGNARKYPALFQKYGHMQVLLPYSVVTAFLIIPFVYAELIIGQYTNNGFVNMWRMAPIVRGLVWSMATITFFAAHYSLFNTMHASYYLLKSFETILPWSRCDPSWATEACVNFQSYPEQNMTNTQNSVEHFYRNFVLSENAMSFSEVNMRLFLFLLATLIIVGVCLVERIRTIEKLQTCITLTPIILLISLTVAALLNQTSIIGISAFVQPDFEMLMDYRMWVDVVNNAMTNVGLGMGGLICISAHGHFRSNIYTFAALTPLCNMLTDILFTLFVYSNLSSEAMNKNITMDAIFEQNVSLLFVKLPLALLEWPSYQQLWSIVYFLYLYITGMRYLLFLLFTLTSAFHETFHCVYQLRRFSIAMLCFMIIFVMPLYISPIGYSMFVEMENFCSSTFLTFIVTIEAIGIFYIYNARNLLVDVHFMLNKKMTHLQYLFYLIPALLCSVTIVNFYRWAWASRDYKTFWIFIIQCVILGLMIVFFISHLLTHIMTNWGKNYKLILAPAENWGCSNEETRKSREFFKSETTDARFTYRQELYERTISAMT